MPGELYQLQQQAPVFLLIVMRLAGMFMFQPVFGAVSLPVRVRLLLVLVLAAVLAPVAELSSAAPDTPAEVALALGSELLLGALIGMVVRLCLLGLELAGQLIAQESGMGFAQVVDPASGGTVDVLSAAYTQLGLVVYLIIGGHRMLVSACLDTFAAMPLLARPQGLAAGFDLLVNVLTQGTLLAVRVAAPVVIALFIINVALGFISRTVPQMNITVLGFGLKGMVLFVIAALALPVSMEAFGETVIDAIGSLREMLGGILTD